MATLLVSGALVVACGDVGASSSATSTTSSSSNPPASSTTVPTTETTPSTTAPTTETTPSTAVPTTETTPSTAVPTTETTSSTAVPTTETTPSSPPTTVEEAPPAAAAAVVAEAARFVAVVSEIDSARAQQMSASWRTGCPVGLGDLRHLELTHWNFEGEIATGELVVHADHAEAMVEVMRTLFEARFPIQRMQLIDEYGGDDDRSMAANNTSAFNCREVAWRPGVWSNHALGEAIDINPLVNPYVAAGGAVLPPEGADYVDRTVRVPGGIYAGDVVVEAFARIGWGWGGDWAGAKDWQHFSASGR